MMRLQSLRRAVLLSTLPVALVAGLSGCARQQQQAAAPAPIPDEIIPDSPYCAKPAEKTAFEVSALKSRLMVAALSCGRGSDYNNFIVRNRTGLVAEEKTLSAFFSRNYGRGGQNAMDDYISQLANMQAQRRTRDTDAFCRDAGELFASVGAAKNMNDITSLAVTKEIPKPVKVSSCP